MYWSASHSTYLPVSNDSSQDQKEKNEKKVLIMIDIEFYPLNFIGCASDDW